VAPTELADHSTDLGVERGKQVDGAVSGTAFSVANDELGIRQLQPADFVILEATGGLEVPIASALATAEIAVAIVNPR
jgi:transposase